MHSKAWMGGAGRVTLALLGFNREEQQGRGEACLSQLPATGGRESWQNTQHSFTQPCFENDGSERVCYCRQNDNVNKSVN